MQQPFPPTLIGMVPLARFDWRRLGGWPVLLEKGENACPILLPRATASARTIYLRDSLRFVTDQTTVQKICEKNVVHLLDTRPFLKLHSEGNPCLIRASPAGDSDCFVQPTTARHRLHDHEDLVCGGQDAH